MVFGAIYGRYRMSSYNVAGAPGDSPWYDFNRDEVFCVFSQPELAALVGVSERTVRRSLEVLRAAELIDWQRIGYRASNRYYIPEDIREYLRPQQTGQNDRSTRSN